MIPARIASTTSTASVARALTVSARAKASRPSACHPSTVTRNEAIGPTVQAMAIGEKRSSTWKIALNNPDRAANKRIGASTGR